MFFNNIVFLNSLPSRLRLLTKLLLFFQNLQTSVSPSSLDLTVDSTRKVMHFTLEKNLEKQKLYCHDIHGLVKQVLWLPMRSIREVLTRMQFLI